MRPAKDLPYSDEFASADDYVEQLLQYVTSTPVFQTLAGGVHIMDFYTTDPGLFYSVVPADWHEFLLDCAPMALLDFLLRDDLDARIAEWTASGHTLPPPSLVQYVRDIRRFSLRRALDTDTATATATAEAEALPRKITMGMNVKKIHEVTQFSAYVERLADAVSDASPDTPITHLVDVGAGQNYLGRALASKASKASKTAGDGPARRRRGVVAVESKGHNIAGAKGLDLLTGVMDTPERPMRNKKLYQKMLAQTEGSKEHKRMLARLARLQVGDGAVKDGDGDVDADASETAPRKEATAVVPADALKETAPRKEATAVVPAADASKTPKEQSNEVVPAADASKENARTPRKETNATTPRKEPKPSADASKTPKEQTNATTPKRTTAPADMRSRIEIATEAYAQKQRANADTAMASDHLIQYVEGRMENGDLRDVLAQVQPMQPQPMQPQLMQPADNHFLTVSIHSCGNLSHYGLRTLTLNPAVRAVAIVGCCYNLMTERLGPPTYKVPGLGPRPSLQPVNGRVVREAERRDPEGFPMSALFAGFSGHGSGDATGDATGIRFNITARMMACQAPGNWTEAESETFFTRHYYRAILQRIFLDRGVIPRVAWGAAPIIVGSLRKACYASLPAYVRGAVAKLTTQGNGNGAATEADNAAVNALVAARMGPDALTDDALDAYTARFTTSPEGGRRRRELSAVWSLMAFTAGVVESAIVADRWQFLREQRPSVRDCWVEAVFDYAQSPRNLVVVGIKAEE